MSLFGIIAYTFAVMGTGAFMGYVWGWQDARRSILGDRA